MRKFKFGSTYKYVIIACALLLAVNVISSVLVMDRSKRESVERMHSRMLDLAETASQMVDGDLLATVTKEDVEEKTEKFNIIYDQLYVFTTIEELTYIYAVKAVADKEFVFTVDTDPEEPGEYGEECVYTDALYSASKGVAAVDETASEDRWGRYYSAYCPIYDTAHNIVGIVGIDYNADWYEKEIGQNDMSFILISVVSLLVGCLLVFVITWRLRYKLNVLYKEASSLAVDVESLTEEITTDVEEYQPDEQGQEEPSSERVFDAEDKEKTVVKINSSSDAIEGLATKIHSMQKELKRYTFFVHSRAYTDTMTGVGNKTAYFETVRILNKKIADGVADFVVIFFDINGLKTVNDNYGHEVGDTLIVDAAAVMKKVFDPKNVYRIGGDEFMVILEHVSKEQLDEMLKQLKVETDLCNEKEHWYEMKLSFSFGIGWYLPVDDTDFKQVFKRADESMYKNKGQYYRKHGDRRHLWGDAD